MDPIDLEKGSRCFKDKRAKFKFEECNCGPYHCEEVTTGGNKLYSQGSKDAERQFDLIAAQLLEEGGTNVGH